MSIQTMKNSNLDRDGFCYCCGTQVVFKLEGGGRMTVINHSCEAAFAERKRERKRMETGTRSCSRVG